MSGKWTGGRNSCDIMVLQDVFNVLQAMYLMYIVVFPHNSEQ